MIKKCCCCGWSYNAKLNSCPLCGDVFKKTNCKACGKEIAYSTNIEFCLDCLILSKRIYNRRLRNYKYTLLKNNAFNKMKEYYNLYRQKNKEKLKEYFESYRGKNKEKLKERSRLAMKQKRLLKSINQTQPQKTLSNCVCCNEPLTNAPNKLYCNNCKRIVKNVLRKYKIENIELSVEYSDNQFTTDLCDQKCGICKYEKCILPED